MSSIAAAKKAEGNAFYAKKMYREAIKCYTEVGRLLSPCDGILTTPA